MQTCNIKPNALNKTRRAVGKPMAADGALQFRYASDWGVLCGASFAD
jgi:hypothetical protein